MNSFATIHWIWESIIVLGLLTALFTINHLSLTENKNQHEANHDSPRFARFRDECIVWLAQGFGTGRILIAPGTFGSLVGILWFLMLVQLGNIWIYTGGLLAGIGISIWICGRAERILNKKDPGSIVLDEIVGLPVCFLPHMAHHGWQNQTWPTPESFFQNHGWLFTGLVFLLFRIFDILKPWPIRSSQRLRGGLGVTMDDVLAGVYVAVMTLFFIWS